MKCVIKKEHNYETYKDVLLNSKVLYNKIKPSEAKTMSLTHTRYRKRRCHDFMTTDTYIEMGVTH